jgi:hypothetical protein
MTGQEHYAEAEKCAALAGELLTGEEPDRAGRAAAWTALAQVHATLALADAARARTTRIRGGRQSNLLAGFDQEPGPHPDR